MSLLALLLSAQTPAAAEPPARVTQPVLLDAFRDFCLRGEMSAGGSAAHAAAAGFHSVALISHPGWEETGAWQSGGIRLFNLSTHPDPSPRPICGVSANIGPLREDDDLLRPLSALAGDGFVEGNPGPVRSAWLVAGRNGFVRAAIDRSDPLDVRVVISIQAWQG
jgi:hypothetical protein